MSMYRSHPDHPSVLLTATDDDDDDDDDFG